MPYPRPRIQDDPRGLYLPDGTPAYQRHWHWRDFAHLDPEDLRELIELFDLYELSSEEDLRLVDFPGGLRQQDVLNAYKAWRQWDLFFHKPLEHTDSLRLTRVTKRDIPIDGPGPRFELEVRHFQLSERPPFSALSYCWGHDGNDKVTFVNGQKYWVRSNLAAFLEESASKAMTDWLWIDAICIDQKSPRERTHQVNLMGQIYSEANLVRVWLGTGSTIINHFLAWVLDQNLGEDRLSLPNASAQQISERLPLGLLEFLSLAYWHRTWVVQEILLARDIRVCCGTYSFPWATIPSLITSGLLPNALKSRTNESISEEIWPNSRYFWFDKGRSFAAAGIGTFSLQELIESNKDTFCSDPRDKIFGMLGLVRKQPSVGRFTADYTASAEVLLFRILKYDPSISFQTLLYVLKIGARNLASVMELNLMPDLGRSYETLGLVRIRPIAFLDGFTSTSDTRRSPRLFEVSSQDIPQPAQGLANERHLKCLTPFNAQPQDIAYEFVGNPCENIGTPVLIARPGQEHHVSVCAGIIIRTDEQGGEQNGIEFLKKVRSLIQRLDHYRFEDFDKCSEVMRELRLDESRTAPASEQDVVLASALVLCGSARRSMLYLHDDFRRELMGPDADI